MVADHISTTTLVIILLDLIGNLLSAGMGMRFIDIIIKLGHSIANLPVERAAGQ